MSLVAFGVRIATVRAIQTAIWPSFTVEDSPQAPLDLLEDGRPLIAVYTGHDTDKLDGRDMLGAQPRVALTIQIFLPAELTIQVGGQVGGQSLVLDTRSAASETVLDVIDRRIVGALLGQAEPWSRMVFELVLKTTRIAASSYLVETGKVRISARELTIDCDVVHEPIPGAPPADCWADLVALMQADTSSPRPVAPLAAWIAAEIAGPATLSQAERDRIDLGLSEYAAQAVGITPATADDILPPGAAPATVPPLPDEDAISADPAAPAPDGYPVAPYPESQ